MEAKSVKYRVDVGRESFYIACLESDFDASLVVLADDEVVPTIVVRGVTLTFDDHILVVDGKKTIYDSAKDADNALDLMSRWEPSETLSASERNPGLTRNWLRE